MLLLPLSIPPTPAPAMLQIPSFPRHFGVWRLLTTTDVGHVTQGRGGGWRLGGGGSNCEKLRGNCKEIAENCGKIAENCDTISNPPQPSRCNNSGQVKGIFSFGHSKGPRAAQLQEAPLNITMKLKHEPKAVDVVIQFVLSLRNCSKKRSTSPPEVGCIIKNITLSWKGEGARDCHHSYKAVGPFISVALQRMYRLHCFAISATLDRPNRED